MVVGEAMGTIGKKAISGSFLLSSGNLLATLISAAGSIVIARLLTPSEYGIIGVALIFPLVLEGLLDLGLSTAFVRFPSLGRNVESYVTTGLIFKLLMASASGLALFVFAGPLALFLARPYIAPMLRILSLYASTRIILTAVTQVFTGLGDYLKACILAILQNAFRAFISIALILAGLGVYGAIWGFSISYALGSTIALALVAKHVKVQRFNVNILREMLAYSLPLYVPVLLGVPVGQYCQLLLAWFATNEEIGNYRIAMNLLTPLGIIGGGISTALLSTLPSLIGEDYKLRDAVRRAPLYVTIAVPPIALALVAFAKPITLLVYGEAYRLAPLYLSVLALQGLLAPLGAYVVGPYFNSVGATTIAMRVSLLNTAVTIPLATILVMKYGVLGLIISSFLSTLASTTYALHVLSSKFSVRLDIPRNLKAAMPSVLAFAAFHTVMMLLDSFWVETTLGAIVYVGVLGLTLPLFVARRHLEYLREVSSGLRLVGGFISKILAVELRIADFLSSLKL